MVLIFEMNNQTYNNELLMRENNENSLITKGYHQSTFMV